jgi:hypothetical protein
LVDGDRANLHIVHQEWKSVEGQSCQSHLRIVDIRMLEIHMAKVDKRCWNKVGLGWDDDYYFMTNAWYTNFFLVTCTNIV